MGTKRLMIFAGLACATLALSSCSGDGVDLSMPSEVHIGKIEVRHGMITEALDATAVDKTRVASLARMIMEKGTDKPSLTLPYAPGGGAAAIQLGKAYKNAFAAQGVKDLTVSLVPVAEQKDALKGVLAYEGTQAAASDDCRRMPGLKGAENLQGFEKYEYGCETQAAVSQMVVDPSDLLGKTSSHDGDSRRSGTMVEPYRAGTPNQKLEGMQASKVGQ